ncbi:MAG: protease inhibitor I42 family protein [Anaerolineaceae bacterium]
MKKKLFALTAILLVAMVLAACSGVEPTPEGKLVVVEPAIKPTAVSMQVGDTLEVRLPTIPQEGFTWRVQDLDSKILKQDGEAVYVEDDGVNAAGGTTTLRFKALKAGSSTLTLIFAGSVDGSPEMSAQSFGVSVEVVNGD